MQLTWLRPRSGSSQAGSLVAVGGAEVRSSTGAVLQRIISLCAVRHPTVLFIDAASRSPSRIVRHYRSAFADLGAGDVEAPRLDTPAQADDPQVLETIQRAHVVYFTGGDQSRLVKILRDTRAHRLLLHRFEQEGLVVGGTSAGASALSVRMISRGESELWPRKGFVRLAPGLGFTSLVIDQHFAERGRLGRLMEALARLSSEGQWGAGIDENTALIIHPDGTGEVVGDGGVALIRIERNGASPWLNARAREIVPLRRVELTVLRHGEYVPVGEAADFVPGVCG